MHNLPFEALLISAGENPRFVLDEFPPIAYVPSASILMSLRQRPAAPVENRRRLLTVGPRYGRTAGHAETKTTEPVVGNLVAQTELTRDLFADSAGALPELQGAQRECERLESTYQQRGLEVAMAHIQANYREAISIPELARLAHLSVRQLGRRFQEVFGMSPQEFLMRTRVQAASDDLLQTENSLGTIAADHGFYDQSAFTRQFFQHTGEKPLRFRQRHSRIGTGGDEA